MSANAPVLSACQVPSPPIYCVDTPESFGMSPCAVAEAFAVTMSVNAKSDSMTDPDTSFLLASDLTI